MTIRILPAQHRRLVSRLVKQNFKNFQFKKGVISFDWDSRTHSNRINLLPRVKLVADWRRGTKTVALDKHLAQKRKYEILSAFHESIEKYVGEHYGLSKALEGHYVATMIERKLARKLKVGWDDYGMYVECLFRKINRIGGPLKKV
jgi:hypothetical protein